LPLQMEPVLLVAAAPVDGGDEVVDEEEDEDEVADEVADEAEDDEVMDVFYLLMSLDPPERLMVFGNLWQIENPEECTLSREERQRNVLIVAYAKSVSGHSVF